MTVLFKDLMARLPRKDDQVELTQLVRLCENAENSASERALEELLCQWQRQDESLVRNAWVIDNTGGQMVGFAFVWSEDHEHIAVYLCVHPEYRGRGIGTLLLRMAEMRARQLARQASSGQRIMLQGLVHNANVGARYLFEREGYRMEHAFLRISCALNAEDGSWPTPVVARQFTVDVDVERHDQPLVVTPLSERDVLCSVQRYELYAKELCPAACEINQPPANLQALSR